MIFIIARNNIPRMVMRIHFVAGCHRIPGNIAGAHKIPGIVKIQIILVVSRSGSRTIALHTVNHSVFECAAGQLLKLGNILVRATCFPVNRFLQLSPAVACRCVRMGALQPTRRTMRVRLLSARS